MKIFIDSAKLDEIEFCLNAGIVDGITTNPSLMKKAVDSLNQKGEKINLEDYIKKILKLMKGKSVSLEVIGKTYEEMTSEGIALYKKFNSAAKNVCIKIPVNPSFDGKSNNYDGIRAIKFLAQKGIPVNCTLIFTPEQALLAAKAGAKIISPFAGRIDDYLRTLKNKSFKKSDYFPANIPVHGHRRKNKNSPIDDEGIVSGVDLVSEIVDIFRYYNIKSEVLAASVRNRQQLKEFALVGADIATVPFPVLETLLVHPKTIEGMQKFTKDIVPEYAEIIKPKKKK